MHIENSSRRSFMKLAAAAPLLTQIAARNLYAQAATAMGKDPRQNVYTRLGVKTVINCRGTWTYLSGSLEFPEVRQAQAEAAQHFVNMLELQRGVGRRLAELTGAESGMVTSGAAGAMAAATAACMAGTDDKHIWQLPDTTGLKHEVIMVGGRSAFDSAIRLTGAQIGSGLFPGRTCQRHQRKHGDDLHHRPRRKTAARTGGRERPQSPDVAGRRRRHPSCRQCQALCADEHRPLLLLRRQRAVRAAMQRLAAGTKRSDRSRSDELHSARRSGLPSHESRQGRNHRLPDRARDLAEYRREETLREWNGRVDRIRKLVDTVPGVKTDIYIPDDGNRFPTLKVSWDQAGVGLQHYRLRAEIARERSGHRSARV